jgi:hypothetical protein
MPARLLGSLVGGMLLVTNARTLLGSDWIAAPGPVRVAVYAVLAAVWALAAVHSIRMHRAEKTGDVAVPERNVVADVTTPVPAGRPSAPEA